MATSFEKGKSIYFLFKRGCTVHNSQSKPRYYLSRKKAEEHLPYGDEIVEYAPVKRGKWEYDEDVKALYCGNCGVFAQPQRKTDYCPHCGAKMDKEG